MKILYIYILLLGVATTHLFSSITCNGNGYEEQCDGTCYIYYFDLDNDGYPGREHGRICVENGT
ncbi:uncharacterized protein METZ01_LOCUS185487, partial [marine metagenome]